MKKWVVAILLLLLLFLSSSPVHAEPDADYYAIVYGYQANSELKYLEGDIATVYVIANKQGMAGIEQAITVETDNGTLLIEIVNWYYGGHYGLTYGVGIVVYKDNQYWFAKRVPAQVGEIYHYKVIVGGSMVHVFIHDSQKQMKIHQRFGYYGAPYIKETSSSIEYWRYDEPGSFFYYGYVTIDNAEQLEYKDDLYHKSELDVFAFYFIHHNWDGITDKGEIDDK